MNPQGNPVAALTVHLLLVSFLAIGGVNAVVPEIHQYVVDVAGWMTNEQFAQTFAIAQAAPGPNMLLVTLIGWHIGGAFGAVAATLALCLPTCLLAFFVGRVWRRFHHARWRRVMQNAMLPLTVGLFAASGLVLAHSAGRSYGAVAVTILCAVLMLFTRLSPVWMLAFGALLGLVGLV